MPAVEPDAPTVYHARGEHFDDVSALPATVPESGEKASMFNHIDLAPLKLSKSQKIARFDNAMKKLGLAPYFG